VPDNSLARQFRDVAGLVNQKIAATADRVILTVAGIGVPIKPSEQFNPVKRCV
jgi:adenosylcobinamide kinase/adenosylcobinamide-phosphate guanylyltransferase